MRMQRSENVSPRYDQLPIVDEQQTPFFNAANLSPQLPLEVSIPACHLIT